MMQPDEYQRKRNMALAILRENPDLAASIQEVDDEGEAMYGSAYIHGIDHIIDTMDGNLLLDAALYQGIRTLMIARPSLALNN